MATTKKTKQANRTRSLIAQYFRALENGHVTAEETLSIVPGCLERVRVYDVCRRFPHMQRDGAEKLLRTARVWPLTTMGNLTQEERGRIIMNLPPRTRSPKGAQ